MDTIFPDWLIAVLIQLKVAVGHFFLQAPSDCLSLKQQALHKVSKTANLLAPRLLDRKHDGVQMNHTAQNCNASPLIWHPVWGWFQLAERHQMKFTMTKWVEPACCLLQMGLVHAADHMQGVSLRNSIKGSVKL